MKETRIILTCDHAAGHIPRRFRYLFINTDPKEPDYHNYDSGVRTVTRTLAELLDCPWERCGVSRFLIERRRSRRHVLFSAYTNSLPDRDKNHLIARYYFPYRYRIFKQVQQWIKEGHKVIHLSFHSYPPLDHNEPVHADIGLLYDPHCPEELALASQWQLALQEQTPWHIRRNYPHRGVNDSITTWLRRRVSPELYLGLEILLNQQILNETDPYQIHLVSETLHDVIAPSLQTETEMALL